MLGKESRAVATSIDIEAQGDHQYVVRLRNDEAMSESWFHLAPGLLEQLHLGEDSEEKVVRRTAEFLLRHQDVSDFPDIVDLEDVIASYSDYADFMVAEQTRGP
jgi:hypothetical protein